MTQPNDPINPQPERRTIGLEGNYGYNSLSNGLTKREYFAALALQGILANPHFMKEHSTTDIHILAVSNADYLIYELNKEK